nr:DEAD/DEAH box helicase family protein [Streptococcus cuniculi]
MRTRYPYYGSQLQLLLLEYQDDGACVLIRESDFQELFMPRRSQLTTAEKLSIYRSLFRGRDDVYAKSYQNDTGRLQYYPSYRYGWKELPADKRLCEPLTDEVLKAHFRGEISIGLFPILKDDTCSLLAIDFDKGDWKEAVRILRQVADTYTIGAHVEISRSGNGAHVWFFFAHPISCREVRLFGRKLLELAMQESLELSFDSFDRMFPNQDRLPKGGFGNLIALPLQGQSFQEGKRVFVDEHYIPYPDQWGYLKELKRVTYQQVQELTKVSLTMCVEQELLEIQLGRVLEVEKAGLSPQLLFYLKRLASFSNPEYYVKQAMRQPTYQIPETICLFEENDVYLYLPRGLIFNLRETFPKLTVTGRKEQEQDLRISFSGQLRFDQELALSDMLSADNGVLCAGTGFGKTVLGAALIAERKKRTLIVVHNRQLLEQWLERLSQFLTFEEEEAIRTTPSGREKVIGHIGQFAGAKKWRTTLVDVAMMQSLMTVENLEELLSDYDVMIVDECHHVTAVMFEKVVASFSGTYLYGLTATPERKNGHEPILFQRIGPILHTASEGQVTFEKHLSLRFTDFGKYDVQDRKSSNFVELCDRLAQSSSRNQLIVQDIIEAYQKKRHILVLSNRLGHLEILEKRLREAGLSSIFTLNGQTKVKEKQEIVSQIDQLSDHEPFVLLSIGKYVGEGFDLPKLDTLILASPLSWKNNLIQYAGRIHRPYPEKKRVTIYDYVDIHVPYLERMFHKRQVAYRKMCYVTSSQLANQSIFDVRSYERAFGKDLASVETLILSLSTAHRLKLQQLVGLAKGASLEIYISRSERNQEILQQLVGTQIIMHEVDEPLPNFLLIDNRVVWFGKLPMLTQQYDKEEPLILRIESENLVQEFRDIIGKRSDEAMKE